MSIRRIWPRLVLVLLLVTAVTWGVGHREQPEQGADQRGIPRTREHLGHNLCGRWLGHEQDDIGLRVLPQGSDRGLRHPSSDLAGQVASSHTDDLADSNSPSVQ